MSPLFQFVRKIAIARSGQKINDSAIRLPSEDDKWLEYDNYSNRERVPFIVYVELECVLRKTESDKKDASSYAYQQHEAFSIGYYVRCAYDNTLSSYYFRRDEGCIIWFAQQLNNLAHCVKNIISANMPMKRCLNSNGRDTIARCVVTSARNRSRRMISESAIIVISPVDTAFQRIQIVT